MIDTKIGESLQHRALHRHPCLANTWNKYYINELGQLCQGIGTDPKDLAKKRVNHTNTFHVIRYEDIPLDLRKGIAFSNFMYTFRPKKSDPNCTCITIAGHNTSRR